MSKTQNVYKYVLTCSPNITNALNFSAASKTKPELSQNPVIGPSLPV